MSVTFDLPSIYSRPAIVREIDMRDDCSSASGSDCSASRTASIKIRILPSSSGAGRTRKPAAAADLLAVDDDDAVDPWKPQAALRQPLQKPTRSALTVHIQSSTTQRNETEHKAPEIGNSPATTTTTTDHRKRPRRFVFSCLTSRSISYEHPDASASESGRAADNIGAGVGDDLIGSSDVTPLPCRHFSTAKATADNAPSYNGDLDDSTPKVIYREKRQLVLQRDPTAEAPSSSCLPVTGSPLSKPLVARVCRRPIRELALGQPFTVDFSTRDDTAPADEIQCRHYFRSSPALPPQQAELPADLTTMSRSTMMPSRPVGSATVVRRQQVKTVRSHHVIAGAHGGGGDRGAGYQSTNQQQQQRAQQQTVAVAVPRRCTAPSTAGGPPPSSQPSSGAHRTLSEFETTELAEYANLYYVGDATCERKWATNDRGAKEILVNNHRLYDDHEGFYNFIPHDHIAYRYEVHRTLGRGSFGEVVRAFDHKEHRWVAVKIVRSEDRFRRQAVDEVRMLQLLGRADADSRSHVVRMLDHFDFRCHSCIVFEPLGIDLYEALRRRRMRGFPLGAARRAVKGIVTCLSLLRRQGIIHCDLKPENVLLTMPQPGPQNASRPISVKVIDFGSSCFETDKLFVYVQSRFYRAPEVILSAGYDASIDMWSLGCIAAELVTGRPLFAGDDEMDQLISQMEFLGVPPPRLLSRSRRAAQFFSTTTGRPRYCSVTSASDVATASSDAHSSGRMVGSVNRIGVYRGPPGSKNLNASLLDINGRPKETATKRHQDYVDFVRQCLQWDSSQRMTPDEAMHHVWLLPMDQRSGTAASGPPKVHSLPASRQTSSDSMKTDEDRA